ncbi:MAG TPA: hypothetical protein VE991_00500, partial [Acidimicrobiales bacterium]|nr:hypothetical protein [Acidimicrobiales bacterium]
MVVVLALQCVVLFAVSAIEYDRYALGVGFGTYAQAWHAIAHGTFAPYSTLIHKAFWRNDAEFILWPLSLLSFLFPHAVDLLWAQDLALVLTEYVALRWVCDILDTRPGLALDPVLSPAALLALVGSPFVYYAAAYDLHSEVFVALFAVLTARALWLGSTRVGWVWAALTLASSGLGGLYLVGVAVSGLVRPGRRKAATGLLVCGVAWLAFVTAVGGNEFGFSNSLSEWYGYLVGPHHGHVGVADVVLGILRHPWTAVSHVLSRTGYLVVMLLPVGLVGLLSAWGWPMALVVLVPSALNANVAFVNPKASFQNWAALPFVLVGSVLVLRAWWARRGVGPRVVRAAGALWLLALVVVAASLFPALPRFWVSVDAPAGAALARAAARIPPGAEVIGSWGVVGRFAERFHTYAYGPLSARLPVDRRTVVFILAPGQGNFEVTP